MSNVIGLVFADMHDSTITDLTKIRTMGSVPFGARYRLIDFALSNLVNSGVNTVGVVTKANYQSLLDHLGPGAEWDLARKYGGLQLLPPYGHIGGGLYRGRMEALAGVKGFIQRSTAEYVIIADTDIIANIDMSKVVDYHIDQNADITIVYGKKYYPNELMLSKTVLSVGEDGHIYEVFVRPNREGEANTSMNIFVLKKQFLLDLITDTSSRNLYSFEVDVIQKKLKEYRIYGYRYTGYYEQIDSLLTYFRANMALADKSKRDELFDLSRPIYTKLRDDAPAKYGIDAAVKNSLIADGCSIEGVVENCVLFRGVRIGRGTRVRNSILLQDTVVGDKCDLNYVITDKNVTVGSYKSMIGTDDYPVFVTKGATV
jgi:glucose-1-phosphate adenylyltransferase